MSVPARSPHQCGGHGPGDLPGQHHLGVGPAGRQRTTPGLYRCHRVSRARPVPRVTPARTGTSPRPGAPARGTGCSAYTQQQWQDDFEDQPIPAADHLPPNELVDAGVYLRGDGQGRRRAGLTQSQSARWATVSWISTSRCRSASRPPGPRPPASRRPGCWGLQIGRRRRGEGPADNPNIGTTMLDRQRFTSSPEKFSQMICAIEVNHSALVYRTSYIWPAAAGKYQISSSHCRVDTGPAPGNGPNKKASLRQPPGRIHHDRTHWPLYTEKMH